MGNGAGAEGSAGMGGAGAVLNASSNLPDLGYGASTPSTGKSGLGGLGPTVANSETGLGVMNASAGAQQSGYKPGGLAGFGQKVNSGINSYGDALGKFHGTGLTGKQALLGQLSKGLKDAGSIMAGIRPSDDKGTDLMEMLMMQNMAGMGGGAKAPSGITSTAGVAPVAKGPIEVPDGYESYYEDKFGLKGGK